jgi:DNA-binding CsgD family transcriptional regulator
MIGRESDLAGLREELALAARGQQRIVVVGGEAGIGKTRLLDEFRSEACDSAIVVSGRSVVLGSDAAPYAPFTGILRELIGEIGLDAVIEAAGPGAGALSALLPELSDEAGAPVRTGAERLYELVTVLFENVSASRPLVVTVEDIHWADTATLELVRFIVRMIARGRFLLLLSYRTDEVPRGHPLRSYLPELDRTRRVTRSELARLDRAQVAAQVEQILGCTPGADTVDRIYGLSEGVPFFVEELTAIDHLGTGEDLPETLRELLLARYERLSEPTQRMLRLISAAGACVEHNLLEAVFEGTADELDIAAREAVVANVLTADTTEYSFRHALVREAIHADLLPGERTRFHARYAVALESADGQKGSASQISYHWLAAHDPRRAFIATLEAMEEARRSYAYRAAAAMGDRALELWDKVDDAEALAGRSRAELLSRTASALRNAGDSERALALANLALNDLSASGVSADGVSADEVSADGLGADGDSGIRQLRARQLRARLLRDKAQYLSNLSRPGAVELLQEALAVAPDDPADDLRPRLLAELAGRLMLEARHDEAIQMSTRAIEEAREAEGPRGSSIAHTIRGIAHIDRGDIEEGLADLESARSLAGSDPSPLLRHAVNASDAMNVIGRYQDAVDIAEAGVEQVRRRGVERTSGVMLSSNTVEPLMALGQLDRAEKLLDPAIALDPPPMFRVHLQRMKLWLTLWRGDTERADELLRRWRPGMLVQSRIEMQSRLGFARVAAEVAIARGDARSAWADASVIVSPFWRSLPAYDLPLLAVAARSLAAVCTDVPLYVESADTGTDTGADADGTGALASPQLDDTGMPVSAATARLREILGALTDWPTYPVWEPIVEAELLGVPDEGSGTSPESEVPDAWRRAIEATESPLAPAHLRPYALLRLAQASAEAGDRVTAESAAAESRHRASALGFGLIVQEAERLAERAFARRHPAARGADQALTEREAQVLALIEQGLSNKQIGETLYISAKTASVHVSSILKKVGATSRTEAVYRVSHAAR